MDTHFASAERTDEKELVAEIATISNNPVMSGLLSSVSGLLAVLDDRRQIIAINDSFLKMLGIDNPSELLGFDRGKHCGAFMLMKNPPDAALLDFVPPVAQPLQ